MEAKNQKLSLSDAVARDAPLPPSGDYIIWDTKTMYLGLRVQAGGSKSWIVQKKLGKRPCRVNLGVFEKSGIAARTGYTAAKARVAEVVATIGRGIDPNLAKRQQQRETERVRKDEAFTLVQCFEEYVADRQAGGKTKARTLADYQKTLGRLEVSTLKSESVVSLTGAMLADYYDSAAKTAKSRRAENGGRTQASLDLRYLRAAYELCAIKFKLNIPVVSPFKELNNLRQGWYRVNSRKRILAMTEGRLKRWWQAVEGLRPGSASRSRDVLADYLELSLLWGGRRGELLSLRWASVNLEDDFVAIPASATKNSEEHVFPVTRYAKGLLEKRRRVNLERDEPSEWVFPSRRMNNSGVRSHIVEPKAAIKAVVSASGVDFSAHDIRRTFGTLFNELQVSDYTVKRALNHAAHDTASTHYLQSRLAELRPVYQQYEDKVLIEAGVMPEPALKVAVSADEYAQFQAWQAGGNRIHDH